MYKQDKNNNAFPEKYVFRNLLCLNGLKDVFLFVCFLNYFV